MALKSPLDENRRMPKILMARRRKCVCERKLAVTRKISVQFFGSFNVWRIAVVCSLAFRFHAALLLSCLVLILRAFLFVFMLHITYLRLLLRYTAQNGALNGRSESFPIGNSASAMNGNVHSCPPNSNARHHFVLASNFELYVLCCTLLGGFTAFLALMFLILILHFLLQSLA